MFFAATTTHICSCTMSLNLADKEMLMVSYVMFNGLLNTKVHEMLYENACETRDPTEFAMNKQRDK